MDLAFTETVPESRAKSLFNLAVGLWMKFKKTGNRIALDQSIECHRETLNLWPDGHPGRFAPLSHLTISLRERFKLTRGRNDLNQGIEYGREALTFLPKGHQGRATSLTDLAIDLWTRFEHTGDRSDLDQSIECGREALTLRRRGHQDRAASLTNLAIGLWTRFRQTKNRSDLNQSIAYGQEAVILRPRGHQDRSTSLTNVAIGLWTRFEQTGNRNDLDQSIRHGREALALRPRGHQDRLTSLTNLAVGLWTRFKLTGDRNDLDQSIECGREALALRPKGHQGRAASLTNLAIGLWTRFNQTKNRSDLDQSIECGQEALILRPKGHRDRSTSLTNVAICLWTRFNQTKDRRDLDQSVKHGLEALALRPRGHQGRSTSLNNLAIGLSTWFSRTKDRSDLDQSIEYGREALILRPRGHHSRSASLTNLAIGLWTQFKRTGDRRDLVASLNLAREGTAHESSSIIDRLRASLQWVRSSRRINDPSVMQAYVTSITLLDRHVTFARSIGIQHSRLADNPLSVQAADLASDAASYALGLSLPERAVELLEQGRSILYSQLGKYRTSLADLDAVDPGLADQFRVLSARLESSVTSSEDQRNPLKTDEDVVARYQHTAAEWDRVVELIRQVLGFSSFLKGKPYQELQLAASQGPVVIVNISQYRSDAIVIHHTGPPAVIPLPGAHLAGLRSLSARLIDFASRQDGNPSKMQQEIGHILRELWRTIVEPVAIHLERGLGLPHGSRIWWMPTSSACSLPLHAAGLYAKGQKSMPERFISSYTPTLSMLLHSVTYTERSAMVLGRMSAPTFLLVSQANANGQVELPSVLEETQIIQKSFPRAVTLDGEACTRDAVLNGLQDAEWVHFACHGHRNQSEPFKSYFSLYDKMDALTLLDIVKHGRPKAELAVLSACHSAQGDERSPDEAVHMAAGMQFSGFKSVVGTLWASEDHDGPIIADVFYKHMLRDGAEAVDVRDSAAALYAATRELRRRKVPFERWINFVHYGA